MPLHRRVMALPWVTFVLVVLVAAAVLVVLRPSVFEARSTLTASTAGAALDAVAAVADPELVREVEEQVELEPALRGSVQLAVERPGGGAVLVVSARAPDPRLAALAADTAAALLVEENDELRLTAAAVVPTGPVDGGSLWPVGLAGALVLAAAVLVERRHDRWERADTADEDAPEAMAATVAGPTAAPVTARGAP